LEKPNYVKRNTNHAPRACCCCSSQRYQPKAFCLLFFVTKQQSLTARSSLLPYDYDLLSGYPNIFPIAGLCNFILPEYLDLSNQQMVNSDLLRSDARSHCSSDLYPCMERISTDLVDYSLRYYSTRALNFRDLRLSDFERSGLQLVQFTADCLLSISTRSPIVDIF
jgi:hypothetical protein